MNDLKFLHLDARPVASPPPRPEPKRLEVELSQSARKVEAGGNSKRSANDLTPSEVKEVVNQLNEMAAHKETNVNFSVDEDTGRIVIKIVDSETKEVVRQLPPDELLDLAESFQDMARGVFDSKI
jgi:flagellar protein FlaG